MFLLDDGPSLFGRGGAVALPSFHETLTAFLDLNVAQVATIAGVFLWVVLLALPLTGIDRRDKITAATYTCFLLAGGVALLFVVPHWRSGPGYTDAFSTPGIQVGVSLALVALTVRRWRGRSTENYILVTTDDAGAGASARLRHQARGERYE